MINLEMGFEVRIDEIETGGGMPGAVEGDPQRCPEQLFFTPEIDLTTRVPDAAHDTSLPDARAVEDTSHMDSAWTGTGV